MANTDFASNYIHRKQLAKELGERLRGRPYSEFTLIAWQRDGKGPPVIRISRDVVYSIPSVDKWLKAQERANVNTPAWRVRARTTGSNQ
jgi:hypothetical protein